MVSNEALQVKKMYLEMIDFNHSLDQVRHLLKSYDEHVHLPEAVETQSIESGVAGEWLIPEKARPDSVVLYFHGGGYALGVYNANRRFVAQLAEACSMKTLLLDYRLAPEHPYPAAIEDGLAAYQYLLDSGYSPDRIKIAGDSSGCGLALVVLNKLREARVELPATLGFISPVVDLTHSNASYKTRAELDPMQLKPEFYTTHHYLKEIEPQDPRVSPFFSDLAGLPPTLIHAADHDVFVDDAFKLYEKLMNSGNQVEFKKWEGMWHNFHMHCDSVPESRSALEELACFLKK